MILVIKYKKFDVIKVLLKPYSGFQCFDGYNSQGEDVNRNFYIIF